MSKKQKRMLRRILVSAALFVLISLLHLLPDIMLPGPVPFLSSSRVTEGGEAAFFLSVSPPVFPSVSPFLRSSSPYSVSSLSPSSSPPGTGRTDGT